ncbi:MAG: isochorismatase family cysteine hydrolase [Pseudomonadota bacterium]
MTTVDADPAAVDIELSRTALLLIDMQRDFLEPGGFGDALGNDVGLLADCIAPCQALLEAAREAGVLVIHTREGHRTDLSDVHGTKQERCAMGKRIGDAGPMGRILVRGEPGHALVDALAPLPGEPVVDKPGKGAFFATDLDLLLRRAGIDNLLVCGVTTEVCVSSTVREASDRGYRVVVPGDCCASYFPAFHDAALAMISAQGGIFGVVTEGATLVAALRHSTSAP